MARSRPQNADAALADLTPAMARALAGRVEDVAPGTLKALEKRGLVEKHRGGRGWRFTSLVAIVRSRGVKRSTIGRGNHRTPKEK